MHLTVVFDLQGIMVREIVKVSILLILLIQFQTGSYNFLHATDASLNRKEVRFSSTKSHLVRFQYFPNHSSGSDSFGKEFVIESNNKLEEKEAQHNFHDDEITHEMPTKMDPHQILMFEQKLLKLLGMKKRPMRDKDRTVHIPKYLHQLYNNQLDSDVPTSNINLAGRFTRNANTIRSFYQEGNEAELEGLHVHLKFDLSSIPSHEKVTGAELHVPFVLNYDNSQKSKIIQVLAHDVVKVPKAPNHKAPKNMPKKSISYPVDTKMIKLSEINSTFWLTFDVFPALSRLNSMNLKKSVALAIEVVDRNNPHFESRKTRLEDAKDHVRVKRSLKTPSNGSLQKDFAPMLLTFSDDGHNPRKARDAKTLSRNYRSHQNQRRRKNHRQKNRRRNLCSRRKMFVDFTDVGWNDWIVAPPGYQAFYCAGECPFPMADHLNASNHAVIQALVNSMNPQLIPPPCCVPNQYSSLSMLYTDSSDRIVLKNYNEMIVDSCGCS